MSVADATKQADIIHILIPDMIQGQVYKDEISQIFLMEMHCHFLMLLQSIGNGLKLQIMLI